MAAKPGSNKKAGKSRRSVDSGDKDRLIAELKNHVAVLEDALRWKRDDTNSRNIPDHKRSEALQESEKKYRELVENANSIILRTDQEGNITFFNEYAQQFFGYSEAEIIGRNALETILPASDSTGWDPAAMLDDLLRHPEEYRTNTNQNMRKNGELVWVSWTNKAIYDDAGNLAGLFSVGTDITQLKRAEAALRESEERFKAIFDRAAIGIAISSPDGFMLDSNQTFQEMLGYGKEELRQKRFYDITQPEDIDKNRRLHNQLVAGAIDKYQIEKRYIRKDGRIIWARMTASAIRDADGKFKYNLAAAEDITDRKLAEDELHNAREELEMRVRERTRELEKANRALMALSKCKEAMVRSADEAMLLADICRLVVGVGGYRLAWIGYVGNDPPHAIRPVARAGYDDGYVDNLNIALDDPIYGSGPTGVCLKSGKPFGSRDIESDSLMRPWRVEALKRGYKSTLNLPMIYEGQILGTLVIYSDKPYAFEGEEVELLIDLADNLAFGIRSIRNRVRRDRAEGELQRAKEVLETRVEERTEELKTAKEQAELYLDLMGHDINNMHQIALGYLEIADGMMPYDDQRREFLEKPMEVLQRSAQLIQNVRKLQKLKEGVFQTKEVDVCKVLVDVQREFGAVPHKAITLNMNGCGYCHVRANELLHDVFANLVSNAIKHTGDRADIDIVLDMVNENGNHYCRVTVEDNGPGIAEDFKERVFNRMLKGTDKAKGMGMGLYLVKSLVDSYGGRVWVEDRVPGDHSKGARFVVMLPVAKK